MSTVDRSTAAPSRRLPLILVVLLAGLAATPAVGYQRGRRSSAAQRAAMQKMQQQMQAYRQDVERHQKEMADKNAEIVKQYDENGDGLLKGPEKSKYDKYMFEVRKGLQPNPFAAILPPGQGKGMTAANKK